MTNNLFYSSLKFVLKDLIGDFLYWPIWWYSKGLINTVLFSLRSIRSWEEVLGVTIWAKNLFTPMYGQYDIEGRLISFFIRLIQLIVRSIILVILSILSLLPIVLWVVLPIVVFYYLYLNIVDFITYS